MVMVQMVFKLEGGKNLLKMRLERVVLILSPRSRTLRCSSSGRNNRHAPMVGG